MQNAAGVTLNYFRSVSGIIGFLPLCACRSIFHAGFFHTASVAFAITVSSHSKNLTFVAELRMKYPFVAGLLVHSTVQVLLPALATIVRHDPKH
jgi:hypothetical protein